jgi:hypothetical protein
VLDRLGIESSPSKCYAVLKKQSDRLLPDRVELSVRAKIKWLVCSISRPLKRQFATKCGLAAKYFRCFQKSGGIPVRVETCRFRLAL